MYVPPSSVFASSGRVAGSLVGSSRRTAALSRCSGRLPQVASASPIALLAPWAKYSAPSGPNAIEFVSWSLTDRGRLVTTSVYVDRSGPVSLARWLE